MLGSKVVSTIERSGAPTLLTESQTSGGLFCTPFTVPGGGRPSVVITTHGLSSGACSVELFSGGTARRLPRTSHERCLGKESSHFLPRPWWSVRWHRRQVRKPCLAGLSCVSDQARAALRDPIEGASPLICSSARVVGQGLKCFTTGRGFVGVLESSARTDGLPVLDPIEPWACPHAGH